MWSLTDVLATNLHTGCKIVEKNPLRFAYKISEFVGKALCPQIFRICSKWVTSPRRLSANTPVSR